MKRFHFMFFEFFFILPIYLVPNCTYISACLIPNNYKIKYVITNNKSMRFIVLINEKIK